MVGIIIAIGLFFMVLERLFGHTKLPEVKGWWQRVLVINAFQLGIVVLGLLTWDRYFPGLGSLFKLELSAPLLGFVAYVAITFVFYWWHRARHASKLLWRLTHQLHHSPSRIETLTSFYKHPLEIVLNSLIITAVEYPILGLNTEAATYALLYMSLGEYLYHINIKTPHWWGYFFQRPEMHRIHHQKGLHRYNYSDLPIWDMLFGTYNNPKHYTYAPCGIDGEEHFAKMLLFQEVTTKDMQ